MSGLGGLSQREANRGAGRSLQRSEQLPLQRLKGRSVRAGDRVTAGRLERDARVGDHDGAISEFQHARASTSPHQRVEALYNLGLSFEANGSPKLAERNYKEGLKLLEADDKENLLKLHYRLGRVAETLGNTEAADNSYNEVAAIDYSYLDVAQRLKRLNS